MASQQQSSSDNTGLAISPALVVGIVIIVAFFFTILFASVYRFCGRRGKDNGLTSATFAAHDTEGLEISPEGGIWNPNRQRTAAQVTRMKEVRWINNMYAWERARHARLEAGELRPTTMIKGRQGEDKSWDEYSEGGGQSSGKNSGPFGPYALDPENPYWRPSSQRMSHLAPPSNHGRTSYMSTGSSNGPLPRHQSALLPPPIHEIETSGTVIRKSPLRNECHAGNQDQELYSYVPPQTQQQPQPAVRVIEPEGKELPTLPRNPNPTIMVNDQSQDIVEAHSPFDSGTNFETVSLHEERGGKAPGSADQETAPNDLSRPREGAFTTPTQRPSVIVTDGFLPQLQLNFGLPPSQTQNSVSVYDEDEGVDVNSPSERYPMNPARNFLYFDGKENTSPLESREEDNVQEHELGEEALEPDNVKGMIQEWERVNGRYGREF